MNVHIFCLLLFYFFAKCVQSAENNGNKLGDVLKNHTKTSVYNSTKTQNDEENLLKQETHKLLSECGVETSDNNYDDNDYNTRRNSNRRGNGNYDNGSGNKRRSTNRRYNNRDSSNENNDYGNSYNNGYGNRNRGNRYSNYGNNEDGDSNNNRRNQGNSNNRYGNKRYNNENYSDEEDSNESNQSGYNRSHGMKRFNRTSNGGYYFGGNNGYTSGFNKGNNGNNGYNGGYNNDCRDENRGYPDGNYGYDSRNYGYNSNARRGVAAPGYGRNFDINLRAKRSNDDEDSQCVSQCVFGYLEVLDDNRVPSETLVIKWLQDHLSNDMKRIRAFREARRCFARLSTSDIEDGCEFSQALSKCLNLELE